MFLAIEAHKKFTVYQMDVKSSFPNGWIKEEVYIEHPDGVQIVEDEDQVCRLKKALYGFKQAPRAWYNRLDTYLKKLNFRRGRDDSNLCILDSDQGHLATIVYVDDII